MTLRAAIWGLVLGVLCFAGPGRGETVPASAPVPLSAYGQLPSLSQAVLSPSGARVALLVQSEKGGFLQTRDVATHALLSQTAIGTHKVRNLIWEDEDHLIIVASVTADVIGLVGPRREYWLGTEVDFVHHRVRPLLNRLEERSGGPISMNTLLGMPMVWRQADGKPRLVVPGTTFVDRRGVLTLFDDGEFRTTALVQGHADTRSFAISLSGEIIGRIDYETTTGKWTILAGPDKGHLKPVQTGTNPFGYPSFEGLSPDETHLYVRINQLNDPALRIVDVATGDVTDAPVARAGGRIIVDPVTRVVIGFARSGGADVSYDFLDPSDRTLWTAIGKAFSGASVKLESISADRSKLLVELFGGEWGYSYAVVDRRTARATFFGDIYSGIGPTDIAERKVLHYKASDGMEIPAYLTLPRGREPKALPLIVLPHGGPFSRDEPGFDWWSQALASRGYAVLQPQFRGSDGFGQAHLTAGFGEYGRRMQTDLSDGVAELARQGLIDPARVAITGASYGGYASLAGVMLQSGVYRCAAAIAAPSDMRVHLAYLRDEHNGEDRTPATRFWREFLGVTSDSDPKLDAISPARHADRASVPILLIHGRDDTVVPIGQSRRMEAALRTAGKAVTLVELNGEDHWLSRTETRQRMLAASVGFLETCNPP